jgi:hypothetical protein
MGQREKKDKDWRRNAGVRTSAGNLAMWASPTT